MNPHVIKRAPNTQHQAPNTKQMNLKENEQPREQENDLPREQLPAAQRMKM